ncbi:Vi polysaccharide biosynthesis UDP-N-acetylglucosamine C-6 dehydrogenase TviB [Sulfurovum sp.]|uniref:Vi polysaccharide biosynthesis UDP-N-acetylglucosamine C-6 dehydrogenase TviB n=1 Tax=Sulfurovum sp. TaxID=1969726 RepID=UPI002868228C|nr:Vi polysaccharide biosynthesis UDP-N-acetylglucosamine C-6 dehydrogenase TviB [Sulfurovum sp.]
MPHKIAVIGLGYVGLPLAHAFSEKYEVIGFDIAQWRIDELNSGVDRTLELSSAQVKEALAHGMKFTKDLEDIADCTIYIVTVPTPIDKHKKPDLTPLIKASESIGRVLKKDDIVIYESTVYPGATEEECVPVLEKFSGMKFNKDFFCGYSPERINPGDKEHTVTKILKVTSGSTPEIGKEVDDLYKSIIKAGTHLAPSIKVAEAAKVIENSQRDINIAFVNELAIIFNKLGINTEAVLEAAGTKWNFLPFRPGLVGGHCIGVDPYYLTHKAQEVGYNPEIILAGRRLNDNMGIYVANQVIKLMIKKGQKIEGAKVLVLGITFKENCPDIRNSRVIDVISELGEFGTTVEVYDPWADAADVKREYGLSLIETPDIRSYEAVILAVAHDKFHELDLSTTKSQVLFDIKSFIKSDDVDGRL